MGPRSRRAASRKASTSAASAPASGMLRKKRFSVCWALLGCRHCGVALPQILCSQASPIPIPQQDGGCAPGSLVSAAHLYHRVKIAEERLENPIEGQPESTRCREEVTFWRHLGRRLGRCAGAGRCPQAKVHACCFHKMSAPPGPPDSCFALLVKGSAACAHSAGRHKRKRSATKTLPVDFLHTFTTTAHCNRRGTSAYHAPRG